MRTAATLLSHFAAVLVAAYFLLERPATSYGNDGTYDLFLD
jgi:hypothetical protein